MNNVVLVGRLTRDPELRFIAGSGRAVANFSIAVNREFSKNNEADFFRVVVWGKPAENVANYLSKGRLVAVKGSLRNNTYETQNGEKRTSTEIVADRVEFLEWGDKPQGQGQGQGKPQQQQQPQNDNFGGYSNSGLGDFQAIEDDDDIPF
jgi:single-strand DNA-binding protein